MSFKRKVMLVLLLSLFVGASVWLSFNVISRPTYEYEEQTNVGGTGISGCVFVGYNGNPTASEVYVYHPFVEDKASATGYSVDTTKNIVGIDRFTFVSDENMSYCYIGPDVAYIDDQAFFGCFSLRAVKVDKDNPYFTDVDGVLYTKDMTKIIIYPTYHIAYLAEIGKVTDTYYEDHPETYDIPEGVTSISTACFYKTWGIKQITLPSTLTDIGDMAFFCCESMELIELPEGLLTIGNDAFSYCKSMKYALYIPQSVNKIGHHCFYKCELLERFYLAAQDEDSITLGGGWQPKHENNFRAEPAVFGANIKQAQDYNNSKAGEA